MPAAQPQKSIVINGTVTKWVLGIVASLMAITYGILINQVVDAGHRIQSLERFEARTDANRFTAQDGAEMMRLIMDDIPPAEVIRRMEMHERRLDRLEGGP